MLRVVLEKLNPFTGLRNSNFIIIGIIKDQQKADIKMFSSKIKIADNKEPISGQNVNKASN